MYKIIPGTSTEPMKIVLDAESSEPKKSTEAALQRLGYILIAWAIDTGESLRAWYLPCDGKRWVYCWWYDSNTFEEYDYCSRHSCSEIYDWLMMPEKGFYREFHTCAPPYILLDSKKLRQEYIAGNLDKKLA